MVRNNKKGAQGIGTLIIFIAIILVAAVAAGVLIQTASSLQSKSLDVGRQSQEKITTDIEVVQVYATGTSDSLINGGTDNVVIVARLGSGSADVKLSDLILKVDTKDGTQTIVNGSAALTTNYATAYLMSGANHQANYLVAGDLATFTFTAASNISEAESATFRIVAKNGAVKPVDVTTPSAMVEATTYLYP